MTAFENYLGRPMRSNETEKEREWYVSRILSPAEMMKRKSLMRIIKPLQLKLAL